jgi:hypothetical protein
MFRRFSTILFPFFTPKPSQSEDVTRFIILTYQQAHEWDIKLRQAELLQIFCALSTMICYVSSLSIERILKLISGL